MNNGTSQIRDVTSEFAVGDSNCVFPGGRAPSSPYTSHASFFTTERSSSGRVGRGRARFRPMASDVSALSSIVANGHQVMPTFPPPPRFIPYGEFSPVRLETQPCRTVPFRRRLRPRLTPSLRSFRAGLRVQAYRFAAGPTGPWLSAVYHARACNRYYGLMRQSDELRPAWACSACSGRSLPSRAVRLTFPSFLCHTVHACCDLYPVG
jgi:hypothetical protein